jgi:hypothetical protein
MEEICPMPFFTQSKVVVTNCMPFHVMKDHIHDFKSMVLLQNRMDLLEDEGGSYTETSVTFCAGGTEEISTKVEEAIDIKEESVPEAITFLPIKTETEVRVCDGS